MRLSEWNPQKTKDIFLSGGRECRTAVHLDASLAHHVLVQRVLRQAHVFRLGQGPHGAVEVRRASEVHESAGQLTVRHHDDVQPAVPLARPRQPAHTHVLLLLAVLLMAYKVVGQET